MGWLAWYKQWQTTKRPCLHEVEGEDGYPRLASDLLKHAMAYRSMPWGDTQAWDNYRECSMKGCPCGAFEQDGWGEPVRSGANKETWIGLSMGAIWQG